MADTTATAADNTTLEQALNKTDLGHWMYEHRKSFIAAVIIAFLALSGLFLYRQYAQAQGRALAAEVYHLEANEVAALKEGKLEAPALLTKLKSLQKDVLSSVAMIPVALDLAAHLAGKDDFAAAAEVLELVAPHHLKDKNLSALVITPYAAALEKNGKSAEALKAWQGYLKTGNKVLVTRGYLEVGRLALLMNDGAEAKKNLEYLVANHPNDELAKLAKLYLQKLNP